MSTMLGLSKNPEKYEAKALQYERTGKTQKALKYRQKAATLRHHTTSGTGLGMNNQSAYGSNTGLMSNTTGMQTNTGVYSNNVGNSGMTAGGIPVFGSSNYSTRSTPDLYERNAVKWEGRNNYAKAQKNREKVWRMQNPQYAQTTSAPVFYQNNQFVGYNAPFSGMGTTTLQKQTIVGQTQGFSTSHTNAPIVETHVRPTIVEQTSRAERIVEIQPVIHRDIDAPQVRVIEKHVYETVPSTGPSTYTKQAIVEETVRPRIIEEVQPVVHREVPVSYVERVEQHVTEHIVNPTISTKQVINQQPIGYAAGGAVPVGMQQHGLGLNQQQTGLGLNQQQTGLNQQQQRRI